MGIPSRSQRLDRLVRALRLRRRLLAVVCAGLATAAALQVLRPPAPPSRAVVVAAHDVDAGSVLGRDDLTTVAVPLVVVPEGATDDPGDLADRTATVPVHRGEVMTEARVLQPGLLDGYGTGTTLTSIRVADTASLVGVRVGDAVDVVGADPGAAARPRVLARRARVVALPEVGGAGGPETVVAVLAVQEDTAVDLAGAAVRLSLSLQVVH